MDILYSLPSTSIHYLYIIYPLYPTIMYSLSSNSISIQYLYLISSSLPSQPLPVSIHPKCREGGQECSHNDILNSNGVWTGKGSGKGKHRKQECCGAAGFVSVHKSLFVSFTLLTSHRVLMLQRKRTGWVLTCALQIWTVGRTVHITRGLNGEIGQNICLRFTSSWK